MSATPATYPIDTIAKLLMITPRHVQRLSKSGVFPKAERGRYELVAAVQGYIRHLQDSYRVSSGDQDDPIHRLRAAKAALAEIEVAQAQGKLVLAEKVQAEWEVLVVRARSRLLSMPRKLAITLVNVADPGEIEAIIEREVYDALHELAYTEPDEIPGARDLAMTA